MEGILWFIVGVPLTVIAVGLYFLGAIIAFARDHPSKWGILILNLLLGWTVIGWVVALVWAASSTGRRD